jgi:protein-disulfide isomerase
MLRTLKSMMLIAVFFALGSISVSSAEPAKGQILGGSLKAPIKVEVYSDFQCPACRELFLYTIKQVLQDYSSKDKVCVIYHEFPLQSHAHSRLAARYAEAAARLGQQKLLAVFTALFTDQVQWGQDGNLEASIIKALSREEVLMLKNLIQDPGIESTIEKEVQLGNAKEIKSTPTMIISYSGKQQKVTDPVNYLTMKQFFDKILN